MIQIISNDLVRTAKATNKKAGFIDDKINNSFPYCALIPFITSGG